MPGVVHYLHSGVAVLAHAATVGGFRGRRGFVQLWRHICPAGAGLLYLVVLGQLFQHSRVQYG